MTQEQATRIRELHTAAMKAQFAFDFGDMSAKGLESSERDFAEYLAALGAS
jgi:hypothetical protein